jgi:hypothetical protein
MLPVSATAKKYLRTRISILAILSESEVYFNGAGEVSQAVLCGTE